MAASTLRLEDGAALAVQVDGEGRDLLLVTGLGGTAAFWEPVVAPLRERGFRVIRFDQRGIGASTRGADAVDIDGLAEDSFAVLELRQPPGAPSRAFDRRRHPAGDGARRAVPHRRARPLRLVAPAEPLHGGAV